MCHLDRIGWIIVIALLSIASGCGSAQDLLQANTLTVGPSGSADFSSISAAVGSAKAGATIEIEAGTYTEAFEIERAVTLVGIGSVVVVGPPGTGVPDPVIEIRGAVGVQILGITVRGAGDGIEVRDSSQVVLSSVNASNNGDEGIDVRNSSDVVIEGTIEGNGGEGIQVREGSGEVAIGPATISSNRQDGVKVEFSSTVTVHSSTISDNGQDGVKIESSADSVVRDNEIATNGDDGILVGESTGVALRRNNITFNIDNGIHLRASPDTVLDGNTLSGNGGGSIEID